MNSAVQLIKMGVVINTHISDSYTRNVVLVLSHSLDALPSEDSTPKFVNGLQN
jgi:hypothetical protein